MAVPAHTGSTTTRVLGLGLLAGAAALAVLGLVVTPPDAEQSDAARLIYIHVPAAMTMYVAFGATALGSLMWLRKRSVWWDLVAASSAEVGVLLCGICLLTGSLWGRPTWGTFWDWDPRLTSTALLFLMFLGYLAVRRLPADPATRNRRSAIAGLVAFPNVFIVHYAVDWWRSLHQDATIGTTDVKIEGLMLFTLMLGMAMAVLVYVWLVIHRFRLAWLEDRDAATSLDAALEERRAEVLGASS